MEIINKEKEIIHVHIYDPMHSIFGDKNGKSSCFIIKCNNFENCGLYKRGECALIGNIFHKECPYSFYTKETGFTRRANSFYTWMNKKEKQYKEHLDKLISYKDIMTEVGDYIFLPYYNMNRNEKVSFFSEKFISKENFTIDNIISMCEFKPKTLLFDKEIKDYREKEIPKFLKHLSEIIPDTYKKLCKEYERAKTSVDGYSYIGRKAILSTITPNVRALVDCHKAHWRWDGKYLTSNDSKASFMLANKFSEIRIRPEGNCEIEITDNGQVNKNTKFLS